MSKLLFASDSKWVRVLTHSNDNEFDLHENTPLISIWMVLHQDSLWNKQQLGNGLPTGDTVYWNQQINANQIKCWFFRRGEN